MMDRPQFWKLIEESKAEAGSDCQRQVEHLQMTLSALPENEIISFAETLEMLLHEAYSYELWAAASIINGGCSDDMFEYCCLWLIAQGEQLFRSAVENPETLADYPGELPGSARCEELGAVAEDAYEEKTGDEMPDYQMRPHLDHPRGRGCKEGEEGQLYPRLDARVSSERMSRAKRRLQRRT